MGTVPVPPLLPRRRPGERNTWNQALLHEAASPLPGAMLQGGQSNQALLYLMRNIEDACAEGEERAIIQMTGTVRRRFQIVTRHREEEAAMRQAEATFADLCQRYGSQIREVSRRVLRERWVFEGLTGYVINGEIEVEETVVILQDGIGVSYDTPVIPQQTAADFSRDWRL